MKAKTSIMLCLSALVLVLLAGVASAAMAFNPSSLSASANQGATASANFVINNTANSDMNFTYSLYPLTSGSNTLAASNLSLIGVPAYLDGALPNKNATITFEATIPSSQATGTYTGSINFTWNYSEDIFYTENLSVSVTVTEVSSGGDFCSVEFGELDENMTNPGNDLVVTIKDIQNNGIGEDDEWYPVDELEIEIKVENDGNEDLEDVVVEWGLWSEETDEWVIEITEEDEFNIKEGKDETITITIDLYDDMDVDLEDLEDGDYVLYARARATGEDSDDDYCEFDTEDINMIVDDDLVVLNDIKVTGTSFCGSTVQITADILNIGSDDQEGVYIEIYSSELGIDETADVGDLDAFEDQVLDFEFTIPSDLVEKKYSISLTVYDEDDDIYENSNDDKSKYYVDLDVSGNCKKTLNAAVYASLESGGKAGEEMEIKATVTNNEDSQQTFTISLADYADWAELVSIEPEEVTLSAGASRDVIITLNVDSDAEKDQTLNIVLTSDDGISTSQQIAVTVETGFSFSGLFGDNAYLWGIALVNLVLIIVIVIVAVKATRR